MAGRTCEEHVRSRAMTLDLENAWSAVLERDAERDGTFVYAVRSTKIYCRPSCPARRPLRSNVRFFRRAPPSRQASALVSAVSRAPIARHRSTRSSSECALLSSELERTLTLRELAASVKLSGFHLQRSFKARYGLSPRAYAAALRLERFKRELPRARSVTEALYGAGYGSSRALYEQAQAGIGMTPSAYRRGGEGVTLHYAVAPCSLGRASRSSKEGKILVAHSARGSARSCSAGPGRSSSRS